MKKQTEKPVAGHPSAVFVPCGQDAAAGEALARSLGLPCVRQQPAEGLFLQWDAAGLSLRRGEQTLRGDFTKMLPRLRADRLAGELLVRAAKCKNQPAPVAVDATAGLGEDAFLLAAAGMTVYLYEYDPIVAALLRDALRRAAEDPVLAAVAARMHLTPQDSVAALPHLPFTPDVVYLDPMFPRRTKNAQVKNKPQMLQLLQGPCAREEELFRAAVQAHPRKIVVKRTPKGPWLAGVKPSYAITGKTVRFDCILMTDPTP